MSKEQSTQTNDVKQVLVCPYDNSFIWLPHYQLAYLFQHRLISLHPNSNQYHCVTLKGTLYDVQLQFHSNEKLPFNPNHPLSFIKLMINQKEEEVVEVRQITQVVLQMKRFVLRQQEYLQSLTFPSNLKLPHSFLSYLST